MKKIGFIGVGIMGRGMVRNLMKNGFEVAIYARNKKKVEDVISEGAQFCDSIAKCAAGRDAVITIVGYPRDVEQVYLGEGGIIESAGKGTYLIDMTTSDPALAVTLHEKGKQNGLRVLDAPVTGGDTGARDGTLSILVGGNEDDYDACLPLFGAMGKSVCHAGAAGAGQHMKLANQIMIAGTLSGVCEAVAYARDHGLDLNKMKAALANGAAGSRQLELQGAKIIENDFAPGFYIKHFIKDMRLAKEQAEAKGLTLDVLSRTLESFERLADEGFGELGTQALIKHYNTGK